MKALRGIVFVLLLLLIFFLLVSSFAPGNYEVTRSTSIQDSIGSVYDYAGNLRYFDDWNPWVAKETDIRSHVSGSGITIGSKYSWEGDTIGSGYMVIKDVEVNERVVYDMFHTSPLEKQSECILKFTDHGDSTEISWAITGVLGFPFERFITMFTDIDKKLGSDLDRGLERLEEALHN